MKSYTLDLEKVRPVGANGRFTEHTLLGRANNMGEIMDRASGLAGLVPKSYLLVYRKARFVRLYAPWIQPRPEPPERGDIDGFSPRSRQRLFRKLALVPRKQPLPIFVTLTYPGVFADPVQAKLDLHALVNRWKRRVPTASAIWKIEPQERGAPHFHLLVWGMQIPKDQLAKDWAEICNTGDERHRIAGTRVEAIKSWRGVQAYAAKYLGKEVKTGKWGRIWGVHNRKCFPQDDPTIICVSRACAWKVIDEIRKRLDFECEHIPTSLITEHPDFFLTWRKKPNVALLTKLRRSEL